MGLFGIFKDKGVVDAKPINDIKKRFEFLISDFNFLLVSVDSPFIDSGGSKSDRHVCYYRNERSRLQLEIVGSGDWFNCYLRRFSYGTPSPYNDFANSINLEILAKIEKDYNYKKYVTIFVGWDTVLLNTADLIKRHSSFFTSEQTSEIDLFDQLKEYSYKNNFEFNILWQRIENTFFTNLKKHIAPILVSNKYQLHRESSTLPPYDRTAMVNFIEYKNCKSIIRVSQVDWRDAPFIYCLSKNKKLIFELDLSKQHDTIYGIELMVEHLKKIVQA